MEIIVGYCFNYVYSGRGRKRRVTEKFGSAY